MSPTWKLSPTSNSTQRFSGSQESARPDPTEDICVQDHLDPQVGGWPRTYLGLKEHSSFLSPGPHISECVRDLQTHPWSPERWGCQDGQDTGRCSHPGPSSASRFSPSEAEGWQIPRQGLWQTDLICPCISNIENSSDLLNFWRILQSTSFFHFFPIKTHTSSTMRTTEKGEMCLRYIFLLFIYEYMYMKLVLNQTIWFWD